MWGFLTLASLSIANVTPTEVAPGLFIHLAESLCTKRPSQMDLEIHPIWVEEVRVLSSPYRNQFFLGICGVNTTTEFRIQHLPIHLAVTHILTPTGKCEKEGCLVTGIKAMEPGVFTFQLVRTKKRLLSRRYRTGAKIQVTIDASDMIVPDATEKEVPYVEVVGDPDAQPHFLQYFKDVFYPRNEEF
jgi:hypothetical protein